MHFKGTRGWTNVVLILGQRRFELFEAGICVSITSFKWKKNDND